MPLTYGYVVGTLLSARGDGPDADRLPDLVGATASPQFRPQTTVIPQTSPVAIVSREPIVCSVRSDGQILDPQGGVGVWLVVGRYQVVLGSAFPTLIIDVTEEHTEASPLDLGSVMDYTPPTGVIVQTFAVPADGPDGAVLTRAGSTVQWSEPTGGLDEAALAAYLEAEQVATTADVTAATSGLVPSTRTIAGKPLSSNVTLTAADVSDSTATGRSVLTAASQAAARTAIGAGTSSLALGTTSSTAKAGDYQPAAANISDSTATGRAVLTSADAAAARSALGAAPTANPTFTGTVTVPDAAFPQAKVSGLTAALDSKASTAITAANMPTIRSTGVGTWPDLTTALAAMGYAGWTGPVIWDGAEHMTTATWVDPAGLANGHRRKVRAA